MTAYTKFYQFTEDLANGVYNFGSHTFKVMLVTTAPVQTNSVKADIVANEVANGFGYTTGGTATTISEAIASGVFKATASDVVFTASGGSIGPFRYVVIYDDTPTSPADPLIGFADYGSSITLAPGETFTVDFDGSAGLFTIT